METQASSTKYTAGEQIVFNNQEQDYQGQPRSFYTQISKLTADDRASVQSIIHKRQDALEQLDINVKGILEEVKINSERPATVVAAPTVAAVAAASAVTTVPTPAGRRRGGAAVAAGATAEREEVSRGEVILAVSLARRKTWEIRQLNTVVEDLVAALGGTIKISDDSYPLLTIEVTGNASLVYSIYSPLRMSESMLDAHYADGNWSARFNIHIEGVKQKLKEKNSLNFAADYLTILGFTVTPGTKQAVKAFDVSPEFQSRSPEFERRMGITFLLADAIASSGRDLALPFAVCAETRDRALMADLDVCFREAGLKDNLGKDKVHIDDPEVHGRMYANIGSGQAIDLDKHFQQRAMLLTTKVSATTREAIKRDGYMQAIAKIRSHQIRVLKTAIVQLNRDAMLAAQKNLCVKSSELLESAPPSTPLNQQDFTTELQILVNTHFILGPGASPCFLEKFRDAVVNAEDAAPYRAIEELQQLLASEEPLSNKAAAEPNSTALAG